MSALKPSDAGYRGALPPRNDWLARGWVLAVIAIFVGMFVLAALNVPTVLFPEPTPVATPAPSGSAEPSASTEPSASGSVAPSASRDASPSP